MSESTYLSATGIETSADGEAGAVRVRGEEHVADTIVALAKKHGIPVIEDEQVEMSLKDAELDQPLSDRLLAIVVSIVRRLRDW